MEDNWREELTERVRKAISEIPDELAVMHRVTMTHEEIEKAYPKTIRDKRMSDYKERQAIDKSMVIRFISGCADNIVWDGDSQLKEFVGSLKKIEEEDLDVRIIITFKTFLTAYLDWYKRKYVYTQEEIKLVEEWARYRKEQAKGNSGA